MKEIRSNFKDVFIGVNNFLLVIPLSKASMALNEKYFSVCLPIVTFVTTLIPIIVTV